MARPLQRAQLMIGIALASVMPFLNADPSAAQPKRSGIGPCRQGALALIAKLDAGDDQGADYRKLATDVVESCGPARSLRARPDAEAKHDRATCRRLALAMLDAIEERKINTRTFTKARDDFAAGCIPR